MPLWSPLRWKQHNCHYLHPSSCLMTRKISLMIFHLCQVLPYLMLPFLLTARMKTTECWAESWDENDVVLFKRNSFPSILLFLTYQLLLRDRFSCSVLAVCWTCHILHLFVCTIYVVSFWVIRWSDVVCILVAVYDSTRQVHEIVLLLLREQAGRMYRLYVRIWYQSRSNYATYYTCTITHNHDRRLCYMCVWQAIDSIYLQEKN